jgi:uncharacterized protein YkwD
MRRLLCWSIVLVAWPVLATAADLAEAERLIARRTNEFRAEQSLGRLEPNAALQFAAQAFADYMARTDRYGQDTPRTAGSRRIALNPAATSTAR